MLRQREDKFDDMGLEFPKAWFWLASVLGALAIFTAGYKIGKRRSLTFSGMALDILRMLAARR